jgi:hypothetical protein
VRVAAACREPSSGGVLIRGRRYTYPSVENVARTMTRDRRLLGASTSDTRRIIVFYSDGRSGEAARSGSIGTVASHATKQR